MRTLLLIGLTLALAPTTRAQTTLGSTNVAPIAVPTWAFPTQQPTPPNAYFTADSVTPHRIPGLDRAFTHKQALNRFEPADWTPRSHSLAPPAVARGRRPATYACAFCHLYDGAGRPENATLAGLTADYIKQQVRAFRDSTRLSANPISPVNSMHAIARNATEDEVAEAAAYYSALTYTRRNRIVETARVPRHRVAGLLYVRDGQGTEPIAGRLIEMPADAERHELHDPTVQYVTYVPPGSLALGSKLVHSGPAGPATVCGTCHGPKLLGVGNVPPIAGRSPQFLLRQLLGIRAGKRTNSGIELMLPVVGSMSLREMVAVAAYVGSLSPTPRR